MKVRTSVGRSGLGIAMCCEDGEKGGSPHCHRSPFLGSEGSEPRWDPTRGKQMECCMGDCKVQAGEKLQAAFKSRCSSEKVREEAGWKYEWKAEERQELAAHCPSKQSPQPSFSRNLTQFY